MAKISVVINTLNEESNIPRALKSVMNWAHEVVVVDMYSDDKTRDVAEKMGAKVYLHERIGYVEPARNFAIAQTSGEWVLVLDADEQIPQTLALRLKEISRQKEYVYCAIPRKNIIFGKWIKHSGWWPDRNIRFFKKGYVEWCNEIHSIPLTKGSGIDLEDKEDYAIAHHHYDSIEQYLARMNRYTSIQAKELRKSGKKYSWKNFIKAPTSEFLRRYFSGKGYKDGVHGLALALLQSFSELVVHVKVWEQSKFPERQIDVADVAQELRNSQKEINYWVADAKIGEFGGIINRVKRKFRLP